MVGTVALHRGTEKEPAAKYLRQVQWKRYTEIIPLNWKKYKYGSKIDYGSRRNERPEKCNKLVWLDIFHVP